MSGGSVAAAVSRSYILTVSSTTSTTPIVGRVAVALTRSRCRSPFGALQPKPARAHRLEVRAAGDERDVRAGGGETRAEISADAAGADDRIDALESRRCDQRDGRFERNPALTASSETTGSSPTTAAL